MATSVHDVAQKGFGKGTNEHYDKARPSYPVSALSCIRSSLTTAHPLNVLEVGSGTGIFTRALLAHQEWATTVHELRAIEPSEGMRHQFSLAVNDPRVSVKEGSFEQTHVPDGWADLIIIAQAFHWCPNYDKAISEFARALNPTGSLVFIWNLEDDATGWVRQLRALAETFELGTPQFRLGLWRQTFQTPSYLQHFEAPEEKIFKHTVITTTQGAIDRALSKSYIALRSDSEKATIVKELTDILNRGDDKDWIDEKEGTFAYPYNTTVVIMRKK